MSGFTNDSPMGKALQERVLPKLVELGWSTGMQDDTLSEYIVLMLANGGDEAQITSELSTDLLGSDPDDPGPANFAKWLFEQVAELQQIHGAPAASSAPTDAGSAGDVQMDAQAGDAEMAEDGSGPMYAARQNASQSQMLMLRFRPTGPKAMRNGKGAGRDKRIVGQINKNLDRSSDSALHRVRGAGGVGRVNSHSRDPPKGPRQTNIARNLAAGVGRGMMNNAMPMTGGMNAMQQYPQQPNGGQMVMDSSQMQQMLQMF